MILPFAATITFLILLCHPRGALAMRTSSSIQVQEPESTRDAVSGEHGNTNAENTEEEGDVAGAKGPTPGQERIQDDAAVTTILEHETLAKFITNVKGEYKLKAGGDEKYGEYAFDLLTGALKVGDEQIGRFSCDQIAKGPLDVDFLTEVADKPLRSISITNSEIMTEIQNSANEGAYFVLPSQLNGAEYKSDSFIVNKVWYYKFDPTGGPRGQLAVHPAAAQFILDNAANQNRLGHGINAVFDILSRVKGFDLVNGYLKIPLSYSPEEAAGVLQAFQQNIHTLRLLLMSGVPASGLTPSKQRFSNATHKVNLVYASAVPVNAYLNKPQTDAQKSFNLKVAEVMLVAQYYGALKAAASASNKERTVVFLMMLGGGVFNNPVDSIGKAMAIAVEMLSVNDREKLDIRALTYRGNPSEADRLRFVLGRHKKLIKKLN